MTAALAPAPDDYALPYADNPYRPADWRWQVAGEYRGRPAERAVRRSVDAWVLRAAGLQEDLDDCRTLAGRSALLATYGPIGRAYQVYGAAAGGRGEPGRPGAAALLAAEIDGYLLAGLSDAEVGRQSGLPPAVVDAYARVFFDVRDRLDDEGWVATAVIGSAAHGGPSEQSLLAMIRSYGYYWQAPALVRSLARAVDGTPRPAGGPPGELYETILEDAKVALAVKASLAARSIQPDRRSFKSVVELQLKRLDHERQAGSGRGDERKVADVMGTLLKTRADWEYNAAPVDGLPPRLVLPDADAPTPAADPPRELTPP